MKPDAARSDAEAGFSLLETLVAVALTALVLGAAYQVVGAGAGATRRAERALAAISLAESALARVGSETPLRPGRTRAREGDWIVETEIAPYRPESAALWARAGAAPFDVSVAIRHADDAPGAAPVVALETLRLAQEGGRP